MSLLLCRWPDGDCSIVTPEQTLILLDEIVDILSGLKTGEDVSQTHGNHHDSLTPP